LLSAEYDPYKDNFVLPVVAEVYIIYKILLSSWKKFEPTVCNLEKIKAESSEFLPPMNYIREKCLGPCPVMRSLKSGD